MVLTTNSKNITFSSFSSRKQSLSKYGKPHSAPELLNRYDNLNALSSLWNWIKHIPELSENKYYLLQQLNILLQRVGTWDFDVNAIAKLVPGNVLFVLGNYIIHSLNLEKKCNFNYVCLNNFLITIEQKYNDHAYHNSTHAADVMHSMFCLLQIESIDKCLSMDEKLACLIASIAHDVGHFGVNNSFLKTIQHDITLTYGYISTLEKMHISLSSQILRQESNNVFNYMLPKEQEKILELIEQMILATDLSKQTSLLDSIKTTKFNNSSECIALLLQAADLGHSLKPFKIHSQWADKVIAEMILQGQQEKFLNLNYSFGCQPMNSQEEIIMHLGFLEKMVLPVYKKLNLLNSFKLDFLLTKIEDNIKYWKSNIKK